MYSVHKDVIRAFTPQYLHWSEYNKLRLPFTSIRTDIAFSTLQIEAMIECMIYFITLEALLLAVLRP